MNKTMSEKPVTDDTVTFIDDVPMVRRLIPIRRLGPKIGRNATCPCGSGKKYKKCCLFTKKG